MRKLLAMLMWQLCASATIRTAARTCRGRKYLCPAKVAKQSGRRQCARGCIVRRLQSRRTSGADLAPLAGPVAADDGLRHSPWPHIHVLQRGATLSFRLRPELYDFRVFEFEGDTQRAISETFN